MAKTPSPRAQELANKIGGGSAVDPTQIDETAVQNAHAAGSIDDGEKEEFLRELTEMFGGDDKPAGDEDDDD
jgi:hypothetical protein